MFLVLGFDFGMKYIGVAVGQSITKTAKPLTTLSAQEGIPQWNEIQHLIAEWKPKNLIVGIPLNMDGTEQPMTFKAREFGESLHQFQLPVYEVDERLSSWEAKNRLFEDESLIKKTKDKKTFIQETNAMAAAILVEQWLRDQNRESKE